jgi:Flp pilus assembly protein TadD
MTPRWMIVALFVALGALPVACKNKSPSSGKTAAGASSARPPAPPADEAAAARFAQELSDALWKHRSLDPLIDAEALVTASLQGTAFPPADVAAISKGLTQKFASSLRLTLDGGGSYKLMANRVVRGTRRVKFRMLDKDGALNYHDYVVVTRAGRTRAVDIDVLITGEMLTETTRRALLPLAVARNRTLLDRLAGKESAYITHTETIKKLSNAQVDPRGALAAYATLPEELKLDRNLMILRLQAAQNVDDTEYMAAMEAMRKTHPNDPSMNMMEVDYYFMRKMYRPAIEAVQRVEQVSGPDAHLNTLRASLYFELDDLPAARRELATALALESDLAEAVTLAIALDLALDDELAALAKIKDAQHAKVDLKTLDQNPLYVAFIRRPDTQKKLGAATN